MSRAYAGMNAPSPRKLEENEIRVRLKLCSAVTQPLADTPLFAILPSPASSTANNDEKLATIKKPLNEGKMKRKKRKAQSLMTPSLLPPASITRQHTTTSFKTLAETSAENKKRKSESQMSSSAASQPPAAFPTTMTGTLPPATLTSTLSPVPAPAATRIVSQPSTLLNEMLPPLSSVTPFVWQHSLETTNNVPPAGNKKTRKSRKQMPSLVDLSQPSTEMVLPLFPVAPLSQQTTTTIAEMPVFPVAAPWTVHSNATSGTIPASSSTQTASSFQMPMTGPPAPSISRSDSGRSTPSISVSDSGRMTPSMSTNESGRVYSATSIGGRGGNEKRKTLRRLVTKFYSFMIVSVSYRKERIKLAASTHDSLFLVFSHCRRRVKKRISQELVRNWGFPSAESTTLPMF